MDADGADIAQEREKNLSGTSAFVPHQNGRSQEAILELQPGDMVLTRGDVVLYRLSLLSVFVVGWFGTGVFEDSPECDRHRV